MSSYRKFTFAISSPDEFLVWIAITGLNVIFHVHCFYRVNMMSNSNYSIGLQRLKTVQTAYGAICIPISKLLMHGLGLET